MEKKDRRAKLAGPLSHQGAPKEMLAFAESEVAA
jgi:hypothetical protein